MLPPEIEVNLDDIYLKIAELKDLKDTFTYVKDLQNKLSLYNTQISNINLTEFNIKLSEKQQEWVTLLKNIRVCPICKQSTQNIEEFHGH
jgi:hypothetical protein